MATRDAHDEVLGVMLTCATALVTIGGALVVYSTRLAFLWEPRSLALALGVAAGGMLFFTLVDLMPEALLAFEDALQKGPDEDDEDDGGASTSRVEGYASLMLAAAFSLGAVAVWAMETVCMYFVVPAKRRRAASREPTVVLRTGTGSSPGSFVTRSPSASTATVVATRRQGHTLVLPSNASDMTTNELLYKTGKARVLAFAVQNVPEGIVLCLASDQQKTFGLLFACAISMLNVTQGMSLAGILVQASALRWRAVLWCVLAALGLPLGGLVAWAITLEANLTSSMYGVLYGVVSGMLVGMCLTQLLTVCYNQKSTVESSRVTTTVLSGVLFIASLRMVLAFLYV